MSRITDERLAAMIAGQDQFADWTDDPKESVDAKELAAALRELQKWRSGVHPETGAMIGSLVVVDPWAAFAILMLYFLLTACAPVPLSQPHVYPKNNHQPRKPVTYRQCDEHGCRVYDRNGRRYDLEKAP